MKVSLEGSVDAVADPNGGYLIMSSKLKGVNAFVKLSWPQGGVESGFSSKLARSPTQLVTSAVFYRLNCGRSRLNW